MRRKPIESLRPKYDYIFLDTAPNATLPTLAAYMNADYFLLSAMPDPFAIAGLNDAVRDIIDARARGNTKLRPPNGDAQGLQRFERELGTIFAAALRDAGPPK
jgi:cellulose biosynthesis protein BcsQ